jgi:hypothetical protein
MCKLYRSGHSLNQLLTIKCITGHNLYASYLVTSLKKQTGHSTLHFGAVIVTGATHSISYLGVMEVFKAKQL